MGRLYLKIDRCKKITSRSVSFKCCSETIPTLSVVLSSSGLHTVATLVHTASSKHFQCLCCSRVMACRFGDRTNPL